MNDLPELNITYTIMWAINRLLVNPSIDRTA